MVEARPGENVTLECQVPVDGPVEALKWIRPDLRPYFVFFYRDEQPQQSYQDPLFAGRVKLRDPDMTNGDMSLILTHVSINDTGTYESHLSVAAVRKKRTYSELRCSIRLLVDSGELYVGTETFNVCYCTKSSCMAAH